MGANQNKQYLIKKQDFESCYSQIESKQYFSTHKGFGLRKTNIKINDLRNILSLLHDSTHVLDSYKDSSKTIKKKLFKSTIYPCSCVGLLLIKFKEQFCLGTGSLIGPNYILTAATNVYNKETASYPQAIYFILGVDQSQGDIYQIKKEIKIPNGFIQESEGSHRYNYALLEVKQHLNQSAEDKESKQNSPGLIYGYFGANTKFSGLQNIYIYGYSIDVSQKEEIIFNIRGQRTDKLICKGGSIAYKIQSSSMESGSPILIRRNQYYHIVGIHISGKKQLGTGIHFDEAMRQTLNKWINFKQGHLDLSNKKIEAATIYAVCSLEWNNLTILNLDNNCLMTEGLVALTRMSWPFLRELYLCYNQIQRLQFQSHSIKNIQVLYLTKNRIKEINHISELGNLKVLELSRNKIEDISQLTHLKYLQRLYLNKNKIQKVPNTIDKCAELKKLQLSRNELASIPDEVGNLKNLTLLSLDGNKSKFDDSALIERLLGNNVEIILN